MSTKVADAIVETLRSFPGLTQTELVSKIKALYSGMETATIIQGLFHLRKNETVCKLEKNKLFLKEGVK
jgi:predicted nuclease of restriction endonuclease-like RecB superfamily